MTDVEFVGWPKIHRLNRECTITEKLDGSNAAIHVTPEGLVAQSRKRIITPDKDNYNFARWVAENELLLYDVLGEGLHFGEWWGGGIQHGYGFDKDDKRFWLFNTKRHAELAAHDTPLGAALGVVPIFTDRATLDSANEWAEFALANGSLAVHGQPCEGVVVYHCASQHMYKVLCQGDDISKTERDS